MSKKNRALTPALLRRQRVAWTVGSAGLLCVLVAAFAVHSCARERRASERLALTSLECAERDRASALLQAPEFAREHAPGPRDTRFGFVRAVQARRMAVRECALAHGLFDALAAASPRDSFAVSPHAIYASALLSAAAGNDAMIRHVVALSAASTPGPVPDFAEELALLKTDRALFDAVSLETPLSRRFPNRYDLSVTLRAPFAAQLAPAFVRLLDAAGPAVVIEAPQPNSDPVAAADLTVSSNFSVAAAWFGGRLPARAGEFEDATGRRVPARFVRVTEDQFTSTEYAQRGALQAGDASQALRVVFISLGGERPATDFCASEELPGAYGRVTLEIPELVLETVTNAATCAAALGDMLRLEHGARYACAYVPTPGLEVTGRDLTVSLTSRAAFALTDGGISWSSPGPTPNDFPTARGHEIILPALDSNAPPVTLTFDRPFLFAVLDPLGLIHVVGRVAKLHE